MITKEEALAALEDMDDFARMANIEPVGAYSTLKQYVEQTEDVSNIALEKAAKLCENSDRYRGCYFAAKIRELKVNENKI